MNLPALNYRKGLFRLWAACSVLWALFVLFAVFTMFWDANAIRLEHCGPIDGYTGVFCPADKSNKIDMLERNAREFSLTLLIPVAVLIGSEVVYRVATWIKRGFQLN